MNPFYLFLASAGISFLGSLQLGPVNSQVLRHAFQKEKRKALLTSIGGALPEILYAGLAAYLLNQLGAYEQLEFYFRIIFIVVIGGLGIYYLVQKRKPSDLQELKRKHSPFLTGFTLALFNPQLIFFWSGILVVLGVSMPNTAEIIGFALGACLGAFLLLVCFTYLGLYLSNKEFFSKTHLMDRILGVILLGLALIESVRWLMS